MNHLHQYHHHHHQSFGWFGHQFEHLVGQEEYPCFVPEVLIAIDVFGRLNQHKDIELVYPTEANEVFVKFPRHMIKNLNSNGYEMNDEEEQEFAKATANIDYDRSNYSEDRGMRKYFGDWYRKKGIAPGEDRLEKALASIRRRKENDAKRAKQVLADIAEMIFNPTFQESLVHSSPAEIDKRVQEFLR